MANKTVKNVREEAVKAALKLAAEKGWAAVTLTAVAKRAKIKLSDLREHFEDRTDILAAYGRLIDKNVLAQHEGGAANDSGLAARDRLFDLLMARFDVLNKDRAAVCSILSALCTDPKQAIITLPHLCRSMSWMLDAAGMETAGIPGALRIAGLTAIYLKTLRVWKEDESADMGKTMAALDKSLAMAESWSGRIG